MQHKLYKERRFFELASEGSAVVNLYRRLTGLGYYDLLSAVLHSRGSANRRFAEETVQLCNRYCSRRFNLESLDYIAIIIFIMASVVKMIVSQTVW